MWSAIPLPCLLVHVKCLSESSAADPKGKSPVEHGGIPVRSSPKSPEPAIGRPDPRPFMRNPGLEMPASGPGRFKPFKA